MRLDYSLNESNVVQQGVRMEARLAIGMATGYHVGLDEVGPHMEHVVTGGPELRSVGQTSLPIASNF